MIVNGDIQEYFNICKGFCNICSWDKERSNEHLTREELVKKFTTDVIEIYWPERPLLVCEPCLRKMSKLFESTRQLRNDLKTIEELKTLSETYARSVEFITNEQDKEFFKRESEKYANTTKHLESVVSYMRPFKMYSGKEEDQIDFVYNLMNTLLYEKRYSACNNILSDMNLEKIPVSVILSYLTATVNAKRLLSSREKFYNRVEEYLLSKYDAAKTKRLLGGLQ